MTRNIRKKLKKVYGVFRGCFNMPTMHFKSIDAYRKYNAYKHIQGLAKSHDLKYVYIAGKRHKVKHETN